MTTALDDLKQNLTAWAKLPMKLGGNGTVNALVSLADVLAGSVVTYKYGPPPPSGNGVLGMLYIANDGSGAWIWTEVGWAPISGEGGGMVPLAVYNLIADAQDGADKANAAIADIADLSKLTPAHKPHIVSNLRDVVNERDYIVAQAKVWGTNTEDYETAVKNVVELLEGHGLFLNDTENKWITTTQNTDVTKISAAFAAVSDTRRVVLESVATSNALLAQTIVNSAKSATALEAMGDDNMLTPAEKQAVIRSFKGYYSNKPMYDVKAADFAVDPAIIASYDTAINDLISYMSAIGLSVTARTNLLTYSENFANAVWTATPGITLTQNAAVGPDGVSNTATRVVVVGGDQSLSRTETVVPEETYTFSFFANQLHRDLAPGGTVAPSRTPTVGVYDLTHSQYIVLPQPYQVLDNEWTRPEFSFVVPTGCTSVSLRAIDAGSTDCDLYLWGAQLEKHGGATPYIATTTASQTVNDTEEDGPTWVTIASLIDGVKFRALFENAEKETAKISSALAERAKAVADDAMAAIGVASSDNVLAATEKKAILNAYKSLWDVKDENDFQADSVGVPRTNYDLKLNNLKTYMESLGLYLGSTEATWVTTSTNIVGADFRAKFSEAYLEETKLLNAIALKAQQDANAAAGTIAVPMGGNWPNDFTANVNGAEVVNLGEIGFGGASTFLHPNGTAYSVPANAECVTPFEGGISGDAYIMFVGSDRTRFPGLTTLIGEEYRYFMPVQCIGGKWYYSDNASLPFNDEFIPNANDCIVAKIKGVAGGVEIVARYASKFAWTPDEAKAAADSKNKTYYQDDPPTNIPAGTLVPGDLWFDTNDNYKPSRWNGTMWVLTRDTTPATAAEIADNAVTAAKLSALIGGGNQLGNSGFELWNAGLTRPIGWEVYGQSNPGYTLSQQTGGLRGGKFARIVTTGTQTTGCGLYSDNAVTPDPSGLLTGGYKGGWRNDQWYVASWYARAADGFVGKTMGLANNCGWNDGRTILNPALTTDWQRYAFAFRWRRLTKTTTAAATASTSLSINDASDVSYPTWADWVKWQVWYNGTQVAKINNKSGNTLTLDTAVTIPNGAMVVIVPPVEPTGRAYINAPNQSAAAGTLDFDDVQFETGEIPTGYAERITELVADVIKANMIAAGQIATDHIATAGLDALTIKTGYLDAARIQGGSIGTTKLDFTPVQNTNVVASINASAEGIKISGTKIQIDGNVTFSSGYSPTDVKNSAVTQVGTNFGYGGSTTIIDGGKIQTGTVDAAQLTGGCIKTEDFQPVTGTIYPEGVSGTYAQTGAKMFNNQSGAPMLVAGTGIRVGRWLMDEVTARSVTAIGALVNDAFYRGNSTGVPVIYDGANGDRLTVKGRPGGWAGNTSFLTWEITVQPKTSADNLDGLSYLECEYWYNGSAFVRNFYAPVSDRKYVSSVTNTIYNSFTITLSMMVGNYGGNYVFGAAPYCPQGYLRVRLHNIYGQSASRDFSLVNTDGGAATPGVYSLGGSTGGGGSGTTPGDGCPIPSTLILMADGTTKSAGSLKMGDFVWTKPEEGGEYGAYQVIGVEPTRNDTFTLVMGDGSSDRYSHNHRFFVNGLWVPLHSLNPGDIIEGVPGGKVAAVKPGRANEVVMRITTAVGTYVAGHTPTLQHNMKPR